MSTADKAHGYFTNNLNCAQSVLGAFCEKYGLDTETAFKVASGLGGGFRTAEICGVVSGAVLVIGLKYGQSGPQDLDAKKLCNEKTVEFMKAFRERYGEITCRGILGCDITTPEGSAKAREENLFKTVCEQKVRESVELLEELGY